MANWDWRKQARCMRLALANLKTRQRCDVRPSAAAMHPGSRNHSCWHLRKGERKLENANCTQMVFSSGERSSERTDRLKHNKKKWRKDFAPEISHIIRCMSETLSGRFARICSNFKIIL